MSSTPSPRPRGALAGGRYLIRRKLGSGSMGTVYLAYDRTARRPVALKVIRTERLIADAVSRMQDEFTAVASLRHPQIASAHDFGYLEGSAVPFYTREYIEGSPLPAGPPGSEPPSRFLRPILDLLDALRYLHEHGILHLDIHAGNLILAREESRGSVLIDVGFARSLDDARFTLSGGAWPALPPEILRKEELTPRSDLFLVGRLLHYRLTGRVSGEPRLPREIPGWGTRLTLDIERITAKALQPAPEMRFASAEELRNALSDALGETARRVTASEPRHATVGRDREISEIEDLLRAAGAGRCAVLRLWGRAGSGKSRLLAEAKQRAQLRGLETVEAGFAPGAVQEAPLLRALRLVRGPRGRRRRGEAWLEALHPRHGGTPAERERRAAEAFFATRGERPCVILLDDLEHADGASRGLAEALMAECARRKAAGTEGRGLAVIAASGRPAGKEWRRVTRHLGPLSVPRARELLASVVRPLSLPPPMARAALARAKGLPARLRRIALAIRQEWLSAGKVPAEARLPPAALAASGGIEEGGTRPESERRLIAILAVVGRPASAREICAASGMSPAPVSAALRSLTRHETVAARGPGGKRLYWLTSTEPMAQLDPAMEREEVLVHERLAAFLEQEAGSSPADRENLARHLLRAGKRAEGIESAREAAAALRRSGALERAVSVLEEAAAAEETPSRRLGIAEEMSEILEEAGDHEKGIAVIEPFHRGTLAGRDGIRVRRRLGIHYHRAGRPEEALAVLDEARRLADPHRDVEDLIFIDSELAELHVFRGTHELAEEASRRGLARIEAARRAGSYREPFHRRMEVMLRATLGHIELRRMAPARARDELRVALKLSAGVGTTSDRAVILHNLAIAENQINDFESARRHFRRAESLLLASGERRNIIKVSTNLAVIEAKLGNRTEAHVHVDRAAEMLRHYPGQQLEYFAAYSRGVVAALLGEADAAVSALEAALPLGKKLGDTFLASYGEVYLAEAHLMSGRYGRALTGLRALARSSEGPSPLLRRMAIARMALIESLLGRRSRAARALEELETIPRTEIVLLEAWNDVASGLASSLLGKAGARSLLAALDVFQALRVPAGVRAARLGLLVEAVSSGEAALLRKRMKDIEEGGGGSHQFLAAAEPLVLSDACFALGDLDGAARKLAESSGAIVGTPFLEIDWRIELGRARLALRKNDLKEARRHLHRSLHMRDHLVELVPPAARKTFLAHPRFAEIAALSKRMTRSPRLDVGTDPARRALEFEGMIGRSAAMGRVFRLVEDLREHEVPVLITGETGSGKELVARAIHARGPRRNARFLAVHCASLPPELFESELFGHKAGSFTGAEEDQPGILESLRGGTLLLDEVSQLSLESQAKLLHVLERGEVRRIGSPAPKAIDVRFLASASVDLARASAEGSFRPDLYYRLRGVEIVVPPLRERVEDIPDLARGLLEKHASSMDRRAPELDAEALRLLERHRWPGNVRELETLLLRALIGISRGGAIRARDLEPLVEEAASRKVPARGDLLGRGLDEIRDEIEREYLAQLFTKTGGDLRAMMQRLGVGRTKLYAWLRRLGLDIEEMRRQLP